MFFFSFLYIVRRVEGILCVLECFCTGIGAWNMEKLEKIEEKACKNERQPTRAGGLSPGRVKRWQKLRVADHPVEWP